MDLLDDTLVPDDEKSYAEVDSRTRAAHLFVDSIAIACASYFNLYLLAVNDAIGELFASFFLPSVWLGTSFIYYLLSESLTGKTLGKTLTGSSVKTRSLQKASFKQVLVRTLIRLIPFEFVSFFFGGNWHDRWSNTVVVS